MRRADSDARFDESELVGVLREIGQKIGEPSAALAILLPCALRGEELAGAAERS